MQSVLATGCHGISWYFKGGIPNTRTSEMHASDNFTLSEGHDFEEVCPG